MAVRNTIVFLLFLLVSGGLFGFCLQTGSKSSWFLFCASGVLFVYVLVIRLFSLGSVAAQRSLNARRFVTGDTVYVTVTVTLRSILPIAWVAVEEEWTNRTQNLRQKPRHLFFPWFQRTLVYQYVLGQVERGQYETGALKVVTGDIFGLLHKEKRVADPLGFTVLPKALPIVRDALPAAGEEGPVLSRADSPFHFSPDGLREYAPGDPLNRIHCKMSAKNDHLLTRSEENAMDKRVMIVLDAAANAELRNQLPLFETAAQVAASLLEYARQKRYLTGFVCNSREELYFPADGRMDLHKCHNELARVRCDGNISLPELLSRRPIPDGTAVAFVTSHVDENWLRMVYQLRARRIPVSVILVYGTADLDWHQRQIKQQMQGIGCVFYSVPHMKWRIEGKGMNEYAGA
jgi:uncharacterized protein (DUF58 family)